jgi:hypothetical protein
LGLFEIYWLMVSHLPRRSWGRSNRANAMTRKGAEQGRRVSSVSSVGTSALSALKNGGDDKAIVKPGLAGHAAGNILAKLRSR